MVEKYLNYTTNHSNSSMMSQHNHEYEQLIKLCTSSTSVIRNANHSNMGFNYVPNYDNLITSHEELVIKDHMKESLSRANSSSLITLPKPVNNPEILCNSDIINHAALIASRPNDIIRPNGKRRGGGERTLHYMYIEMEMGRDNF